MSKPLPKSQSLKVKAASTIRREISTLRKYAAERSTSDGGKIQAESMIFALEWTLGKWGMAWSDWLTGCKRPRLTAEKQSRKKVKS